MDEFEKLDVQEIRVDKKIEGLLCDDGTVLDIIYINENVAFVLG